MKMVERLPTLVPTYLFFLFCVLSLSMPRTFAFLRVLSLLLFFLVLSSFFLAPFFSPPSDLLVVDDPHNYLPKKVIHTW